MRSIEMTGKTVDIAIFNGLQQLGLSIDEVTIEILQTETKGILGFGAKPAKVRLTEKPQEEVVIPDFEAERSQRERREKRKDEGRTRGRDKDEHRDDRRDDNREHRKGERVRQGQEQAKASEDTSAKPDQQSAEETVRRRPDKKKPYRNVNEMLAAMGSSVDSELDENFPVDESLGEATSLGNGSSSRYGNSRYDSGLFSSNVPEKGAEPAESAYSANAAEPVESAYTSEPAESAYTAEPAAPASVNERENDDGKHISSIMREAERYAQSLEDAESYRKKPSKNYQRGKGNNRNNKDDFRNNRTDGNPDRKNAKFKQDNETAENTKAVMLPESEVNYTEEAAVGNPAAEFVKNLVEHMCIEAKVLAACDADAIRLRIDSDAMGALIGHRGETLDSIQYLTALVINRNRKEEGYTRVTINTEDYREKREETLTKLAKRVAQQVRNTGRARVLEPMNPYERRILHSALQNNPFVLTHSEGEEPNRRVVVTPKRRNRGYNNRRYDNKRGFEDRGRSHSVRESEGRSHTVRGSEMRSDEELHTPAFTPANPAVPAVEQVTE